MIQEFGNDIGNEKWPEHDEPYKWQDYYATQNMYARRICVVVFGSGEITIEKTGRYDQCQQQQYKCRPDCYVTGCHGDDLVVRNNFISSIHSTIFLHSRQQHPSPDKPRNVLQILVAATGETDEQVER